MARQRILRFWSSMWLLLLLQPPLTRSYSQQHLVPATQRHVMYRSQRTVPLYKQPQDSSDRPVVIDEPSAIQTPPDEQTWQVLADASKEHPDHVFRRLRQEQEQQSKESLSDNKQRRRLRQADPLPEEPQDDDLSSQVVPEFEQGLHNTSNDFNVSAQTEYNVSSSLQDSNGTTSDSSTVVYTQSEPNNNASLHQNETAESQTPVFYPIRIRAFLSEIAGGGEHLEQEERNRLLQDIVRPALLSWSAALRVDPVVGNLTVDPHQLLDGTTCGPPGLSVPVPAAHLTQGVVDTDLILYISLAFQKPSASNVPSSSPTVMGSFPHQDVNGKDFGINETLLESQGEAQVNSEEEQQQQDGNQNDDETQVDMKDQDRHSSLADFNSKHTAPKAECQGDYLAAASFCSTDQFDRPTAAILHLCIGDSFFDQVPKNILVIQHELGHALGFNAVSLAHFRRPDGSPLTRRNSQGQVPLTEIDCTGPQHVKRRAKVALPSPEILQFQTVRGGVRVAQVVTPSVAQVARNHFDCQTLPGAELESGEFLPSSTNQGQVSCLGDHWERRLFKTDLMNPVVETSHFNPRISTITLAYFADSGWYQVDLARAATTGGWGRGAGCAFVEETCIDPNGQVPDRFAQFFCNQPPRVDSTMGYSGDIQGCSQDSTRKAVCTMGEYDQELPLEYQYFPYGANVGGSDPFMDYCPVYAGYSNGLCSDAQNDRVIRVNKVERFGRRNSRCLNGSMRHYTKTALCLPIACVVEDRTLRIQIDGEWRICNQKNELLPAGSPGSFVTCPDPVRICPTFYCYRDCLGTYKRCDFEVGECICNSTACRPGNETEPSNRPQFFDSTPDTTRSIPEDDSPLADIYVTNARSLKEERRRSFFRSWEWQLLVYSCSLLLIGFICYRRRTKQDSVWIAPDVGPDNDANPSAELGVHNPNKDKMLATVVVDMRMHDQQDPLHERTSETDLSMTDTDGAASHITNMSLETAEEEMEETDSKPRAVIRRRRHVGH